MHAPTHPHPPTPTPHTTFTPPPHPPQVAGTSTREAQRAAAMTGARLAKRAAAWSSDSEDEDARAQEMIQVRACVWGTAEIVRTPSADGCGVGAPRPTFSSTCSLNVVRCAHTTTTHLPLAPQVQLGLDAPEPPASARTRTMARPGRPRGRGRGRGVGRRRRNNSDDDFLATSSEDSEGEGGCAGVGRAGGGDVTSREEVP